MLRGGHNLFFRFVGCRNSRSLQEPLRTSYRRLPNRIGCDPRFFMGNLVRYKATGWPRNSHAENWLCNADIAHALCSIGLALAVVFEHHFPFNVLCGIQLDDIHFRSCAGNGNCIGPLIVSVSPTCTSGSRFRAHRVSHLRTWTVLAMQRL
jgi:hypothetical protein